MTEVSGFIRNQNAWLELCARVHRELLPEEDMPGLGYHIQVILKKSGWRFFIDDSMDDCYGAIKKHLERKESEEMERNNDRERALKQIHEWQIRDAIPLKALALICHAWQHDRDVMRAIREAGFTNAKHMARAVNLFKSVFDGEEFPEREAYEKLFALARLPDGDPQLYHNDDEGLDEVQSRVQKRLAELKPKSHDRPLVDIVVDYLRDPDGFITEMQTHKSVQRAIKRRVQDAQQAI